MNSEMRNQNGQSSTPIPFVPWENGSLHHQQYHGIEQRDYRRRLAGAVRTLLNRQTRAYHRRINQLQEQWHHQQQQQQQQMRMYQSAPTECVENEDVIRLTVDLPGVSRDEIQIQLVPLPLQYELRITAKRSYMSIDRTSCVSTHTKSQRYGINPNVVDVTQINATLRNGVLTITAPKKKAVNPTENSLNGTNASKDNSKPNVDDRNNDNTMDSPVHDEVKPMNAVIIISISEE